MDARLGAIGTAVVISFSSFFLIWVSIGRKYRGIVITFVEEVNNRHDRYLKISQLIVTLCSASLAYFSKHPLLVSGEGGNVAQFAYGLTLVLLGLCIVFSVVFMAILAYFYQSFLADRNSYSASRYGLATSLGFTSLICFGVAYLSFAIALLWNPPKM